MWSRLHSANIRRADKQQLSKAEFLKENRVPVFYFFLWERLCWLIANFLIFLILKSAKPSWNSLTHFSRQFTLFTHGLSNLAVVIYFSSKKNLAPKCKMFFSGSSLMVLLSVFSMAMYFHCIPEFSLFKCGSFCHFNFLPSPNKVKHKSGLLA